MAYRMQQSSIHPRQARESARIYTVVFVVVVVNHPNSSRIGHDDFVSEAAQEPADPRRVSSHLKHDPAAVCTLELRGKPCRGRSECSLREDFAFVAEDTVVTGFIADVDANDLIPPRGCQLRLFAALCSVAIGSMRRMPLSAKGNWRVRPFFKGGQNQEEGGWSLFYIPDKISVAPTLTPRGRFWNSLAPISATV